MKKYLSAIITLIIILSSSFNAFASSSNNLIEINANSISAKASNGQYGINLDNSSSAVDESLSANLICNGSFENKTDGWQFSDENGTYGNENSINKNNKTYDIINANGAYTIDNIGYNENGISFIKGNQYNFSMQVKNVDFSGSISVCLSGSKGSNEVTPLSTQGMNKKDWQEVSATITPVSTESGKLSIQFKGNGSMQIDNVCLTPKSSYGEGNSAWKNALLRTDLFNAMQCLSPAFVRFTLNGSSWKQTIGAQYERAYNSSTNYIGYHEYLQLCSDLKSNAIPSISISDADASSTEFSNYKQDILDLIEYANADANTSYYGALRANNGSTEPFGLKYIQITGDNESANKIKKAINSKYDNIKVLGDSDINIIEANAEGDIENMLNTASSMLESDTLSALNITFSNGQNSALIKYDSDSVAYFPSYYAQMILNQSTNANTITASNGNDKITQKITVNKANGEIFASLINNGSAKEIALNLIGFEQINRASIQSVGDGYLTATNKIGKQFVAPTETELSIDNGSINVKLPSNSVSVVRIAFANNNGDGFYKLPDTIDYKANNFIPDGIKVFIAVLCISIPLGGVMGYFIYTKIISKSRK